MVQVTRVRVEGTNAFLSADSFGMATGENGQPPFQYGAHKKACLCPDPQCVARMVHVRAHDQTYYDEGGAYTLRVAAHFRRHPKSPPHAEKCAIAQAYHRYADQARHFGGSQRGEAGFVYNLNIMTDTRPAPGRGLARHFPAVKAAPQITARYAASAGYSARAPWSKGINHIRMLAQLLDETAFDPGLRAENHMRRNSKLLTLAEMYKEDAVALLRAGHSRSKALRDNPSAPRSWPMLFNFRPIMTPKSKELTFWDGKAQSVTGAPQKIEDAKGNAYYISARLNFGSKDLYRSFIKMLRGGEKSFLAYDDRVSVDMEDFMRMKEAMHNKHGHHHAVFVDMHINCAEQILPWTPRGAQMDLSGRMDMPVTSPHGAERTRGQAKRPSPVSGVQLKLPL